MLNKYIIFSLVKSDKILLSPESASNLFKTCEENISVLSLSFPFSSIIYEGIFIYYRRGGVRAIAINCLSPTLKR